MTTDKYWKWTRWREAINTMIAWLHYTIKTRADLIWEIMIPTGKPDCPYLSAWYMIMTMTNTGQMYCSHLNDIKIFPYLIYMCKNIVQKLTAKSSSTSVCSKSKGWGCWCGLSKQAPSSSEANRWCCGCAETCRLCCSKQSSLFINNIQVKKNLFAWQKAYCEYIVLHLFINNVLVKRTLFAWQNTHQGYNDLHLG